MARSQTGHRQQATERPTIAKLKTLQSFQLFKAVPSRVPLCVCVGSSCKTTVSEAEQATHSSTTRHESKRFNKEYTNIYRDNEHVFDSFMLFDGLIYRSFFSAALVAGMFTVVLVVAGTLRFPHVFIVC